MSKAPEPPSPKLVEALASFVQEHGWVAVMNGLLQAPTQQGSAEAHLQRDLTWVVGTYINRLRSTTLKDRNREVYRLHNDGRSFAQIAVLFGISNSWAQTIYQQYQRRLDREMEQALKRAGATMTVLERDFCRYGPELFEQAVAAIEARGGAPPPEELPACEPPENPV